MRMDVSLDRYKKVLKTEMEITEPPSLTRKVENLLKSRKTMLKVSKKYKFTRQNF